jgi:hypothetical protein
MISPVKMAESAAPVQTSEIRRPAIAASTTTHLRLKIAEAGSLEDS